VKDCAWIAQLLEHGLIRGSFVPPAPIRELRDLTRYRKALIQERTREANRLHKVLEDAGIKLASVASDVLGVSGRAMVEALVAGTTDPAVLADLARGALRKKLPALRQALAGRFRAHHAFLVTQLLAHLDYLDEVIATLSVQVDVVIAPFAEDVARLDTIHGVNKRTAEVIIAEVGADMRVFPTAGHLASWAGLCPGNNESAGKHRPGKTRKGNKWLRGALTEAALAAGTRSAKGGLRRALPAHHAAPGTQEGRDCRRPRHSGDGVSPARAQDHIPRAPGPSTTSGAMPSACVNRRSTPWSAKVFRVTLEPAA
jgi:transposase